MKAAYIIRILCLLFVSSGVYLAHVSDASASAPTGFTSVQYQDVNSDATIDRLVVVINGGEALDSCVVSAGELTTDWTYVGNALSGSIASATCDTATATITFVISGATGATTGTGSPPTIAYDNDDADGSISNTTADLGTVTATTAADGAPPLFRSSSFQYYGDPNGDGQVDTLSLLFSEDVVGSYEAGDWAIVAPGTINVTALSNFSIDIFGDIIFTLTADPDITGGGVSPQYSYTNQGTLNSITDGAGNPLASSGARTMYDLAGPQIKWFTYQDADLDGKIDRLLITFTETATSNSTLRATDLVFDNVGDFTGAVIGSDATDLITTSVSSVTLVLGTEATAVDTANGNSSIAIRSQNLFQLRDANFSNNDSLKVQSQADFVDGAAPVYVSSSTLDNNQNGTVDFVRIVYSEPISDASVAGSDFHAGFTGVVSGALGESFTSGTPASGVVTDTANDSVIYVGVSSGTDVIAPNKTDYTLHVAQTGSISDPSGNVLASFSEKTSTDGAAPALYSSTVIDSFTNDNTPTIFFSIIEDGTLSYSGGCTMPLTTVAAGAFTQAFNALMDGTYTCSIRGTDGVGNLSAPLTFNSFTVDTVTPVLSLASVSQNAGVVTVSWATDETTSSTVNYGTTTAYGSSTIETDIAPRVTTHTVHISGLTGCITYHFLPRSSDAAGNEVVGSDLPLNNVGSCGGGGGLPSAAYSKPIIPSSGFQVRINNGETSATVPAVNLKFNAGPDVARVAVSNRPDLLGSGQQVYSAALPWNLCTDTGSGLNPSTCAPGIYTVYARFYTSYGQPSDIVSATIQYVSSASPSAGVKQYNALVLDKGTIYLLMGDNAYGFATMQAFTGLGYLLRNVQKGIVNPSSIRGVLTSASSAHPEGAWVLSRGTVYYVTAAGLIPVSTWKLFLDSGGKVQHIVPASKADLAKPVLSLLEPNDMRLLQ